MDKTDENIHINAKHKDRLFRKLFGEEQYKHNLLSLYNAVNGTHYVNLDDLTINTIDDVVYMGMKNDVSCLFESQMSLFEHQSTRNPNMPLRGLLYFSKLYDKFIKTHEVNIFSSSQVKIPTPQYYVFYNGTEAAGDRTVLKLSDAFEVPTREGVFEWTAIMLNVNYGRNQELMDKCRVLNDYAIFNAEVRKQMRGEIPAEEAVHNAVQICIQNNVLREFLVAHKSEVIGVVLTEYDEQATWAAIRKEEHEFGREEGRKEGLEEGRKTGRKEGLEEGKVITFRNMLKRGYSVKEAQDISELTDKQVGNILKQSQ